MNPDNTYKKMSHHKYEPIMCYWEIAWTSVKLEKIGKYYVSDNVKHLHSP